MENKPIVTCHGDQTLFSKLHSAVVAGLPKESIEWRRSYGRAPRKVCVEANFVPFNPDIIPGEEDWTLLGRPFFHTYWTDCDMDNYKSSVRDDIADWLSELKGKGATDWLIIVVVNDESKVKSKLLRTSVIDKIRSEFCAKQTEKCVVLQEPLKVDSRSAETWLIMLSRMRQLLLASYNKNLSRFEEYMRAQRERRQEPGWNFSQYFMLQEELGFMFEMLGLYEDALVQYDELDALFTQFVLNHAAGDTAEWISAFSEMTCTSWDGLCLSQPINIDKRQLIKRNKASLLDFRNYLYSRQCMLLFLLARPAEVAQRSIPFMHNCIQELNILEIEMPPGSVACWIFLTCLEVLQTCEKFSDNMESYSLFTVSLWDYARNKMHELGILCGLMPEEQTTSQQLNLVVDLISGMTRKEGEHTKDDEILLEVFIGNYKRVAGLRICYDKYGSTFEFEHGESEPLEKLREALSSKESFKKHYLELSELAMGTYKHIGRIRSARLIGRDLADFYMKLGEPAKAEGFLLESLKTYKTEGWSVLADHIRLQMALCQKKLDNPQRYVKSCMYVAASQILDSDTREQYQQEVLRIAKENSDMEMLLRSRPVFSITDVQLPQSSIILQEDISVHLTISSNLLQPITADKISIALKLCEPQEKDNQSEETDHIDISPRRPSIGTRSSRSRHTSKSSINDVEAFDLSQYVATFVPEYLDIHPHVEKKENNRSILSTSLVLKTGLKRMDSSGPQFLQSLEVAQEDYTEALFTGCTEIKPGKNSVTLTGKPTKKGQFCLNQLCIQVQGLRFLKTLAPAEEVFDVVCDQPSVSLQPQDILLTAGLPQILELRVHTGSFSFPQKGYLKIKSTPGLDLSGKNVIDGELMLPPSPPNHTEELQLTAFAELSPDSQLQTQHQVILESEWLKEVVEVNLTFQHPLSIKHALHTAGTRKYVQVTVQSSSAACYMLTDHCMESSSPDVQFTSLNKPGQEMEISEDRSISYVWQAKVNTEECPPVPCTFSVTYRPSRGQIGKTWTCRYNFTLSSYKTLYAVKSEVLPGPKLDQCYTGCMCGLKVHVKALGVTTSPKSSKNLLYSVQANSTYWALAGKTTGVFTLKGDQYETQLEVMPLIAGYLPLPSVHLAPHSPDTGQSTDGDKISSAEEFLVGQVYNSSAASQVYVLPTPNTSHIDVTAQG